MLFFFKAKSRYHKVLRVQKRCPHTLSLQFHVFGKGASTVYKARLQFYSSNNGCVHSPFKAGRTQQNVTRTSSVWPSGEEKFQMITPKRSWKCYSYSRLAHPKMALDKREICLHRYHHVFLWHWTDSPCEKHDSKCLIKLPFQRRWLIKTPPAILNAPQCNLISTSFCCHQGLSCSQPHKGSSLRLKSTPHKILFEINSVTFTTQRQAHCQPHHKLEAIR